MWNVLNLNELEIEHNGVLNELEIEHDGVLNELEVEPDRRDQYMELNYEFQKNL